VLPRRDAGRRAVFDLQPLPVWHQQLECPLLGSVSDERSPKLLDVGSILGRREVIDPHSADILFGEAEQEACGPVRGRVPAVIACDHHRHEAS
jgi:hypothetical protein